MRGDDCTSPGYNSLLLRECVSLPQPHHMTHHEVMRAVESAQLGAALAVSHVTRLPLILPQLVCYCDVAWCGPFPPTPN